MRWEGKFCKKESENGEKLTTSFYFYSTLSTTIEVTTIADSEVFGGVVAMCHPPLLINFYVLFLRSSGYFWILVMLSVCLLRRSIRIIINTRPRTDQQHTHEGEICDRFFEVFTTFEFFFKVRDMILHIDFYTIFIHGFPSIFVMKYRWNFR